VLSFLRFPDDGDPLACIANLSPVCREGYRVGLPGGGRWREVLNTDVEQFAGSGVGNGVVDILDHGLHGLPFSVELTLPPLAVLWLSPAWRGHQAGAHRGGRAPLHRRRHLPTHAVARPVPTVFGYHELWHLMVVAAAVCTTSPSSRW